MWLAPSRSPQLLHKSEPESRAFLPLFRQMKYQWISYCALSWEKATHMLGVIFISWFIYLFSFKFLSFKHMSVIFIWWITYSTAHHIRDNTDGNNCSVLSLFICVQVFFYFALWLFLKGHGIVLVLFWSIGLIYSFFFYVCVFQREVALHHFIVIYLFVVAYLL